MDHGKRCLRRKIITIRQILFIGHRFIEKKFVHFVSQCMWDEGRKFKKEIRKASVQLWRAEVPHITIRTQLKMLKSPWRGSWPFKMIISSVPSSPGYLCCCGWERSVVVPGESSGSSCKITPALVIASWRGSFPTLAFQTIFLHLFPHLGYVTGHIHPCRVCIKYIGNWSFKERQNFCNHTW
jgi:hypothetical protein